MKGENLELLSMCCVCKAIKVEGRWMREEENPELYRKIVEEYENPDKNDKHQLLGISHGLCDDKRCYERFVKGNFAGEKNDMGKRS